MSAALARYDAAGRAVARKSLLTKNSDEADCKAVDEVKATHDKAETGTVEASLLAVASEPRRFRSTWPPPPPSPEVRAKFDSIKARGGNPRYYTDKHRNLSVMDVSNIGRANKSRRKSAAQKARDTGNVLRELRNLAGVGSDEELVAAFERAFPR